MNNKIIVLPEQISNRIAAGEIIERPASVVRELLDNSIDAGSDYIELEIKNGGLSFISVIDNGCGMDPDSILLAFERHATSKIHTLDDLNTIRTLGFRGEALPSIASVAKIEIESYASDYENGMLLKIESGKIITAKPVACPPGTRVTVNNLFYKVPARRKFLRTEKTEFGHIWDTYIDHALLHLSIYFKFRADSKIISDAPAVDSWHSRINTLLGSSFLKRMLPVDMILSDIKIQGFISHPEYLHATARSQKIYVNGRRIRDRIITQAIYRGYREYLSSKGHPVFAMKIEIPPEQVDVNVHPTKSEVRFLSPQKIFNTISHAIQNALSQSLKTTFGYANPKIISDIAVKTVDETKNIDDQRHVLPYRSPIHKESGLQVDQQEIFGNDIYHTWSLVGQIFNLFIIVEYSENCLIIDQHTAHERILFERFRIAYKDGTIASQSLLFPIPVELDPIQFSVIHEFSSLLKQMGIHMEEFGTNTFLVRALPDHLHQETPELLLKNIADELTETGHSDRNRTAERKMLISLSCRKAIKA
ncbi:DNA mismatch repair endonuclease MutL, partial [bacterium]|nr:DNA mismatch repair endonuclease MutL [candidate division CSSED10-310 bacterium]